jgi:hypothetical protein
VVPHPDANIHEASVREFLQDRVPSNAVWAQTVIASLFAVVAFIVLPSVGVGYADRDPDQGVRRHTSADTGTRAVPWCFG